MRVILLGPPGTGKGTFAQRLSDEFKVEKIVTGNLVREEVNKKSKIGIKIKELVEQGHLVPTKIIVKLIEDRIKDKKDFIIDGFPRTLEQLELFKDKIDKVIFINSSYKISVKRLGNRVICRNCHRVYHLINNPPKVKGICDICGGELYIREDETKGGIKKRLELYKKETLPVIEHYRKKGLLIEINGDGSIDEIYPNIRKLFK